MNKGDKQKNHKQYNGHQRGIRVAGGIKELKMVKYTVKKADMT